ncbi:alpha/beta-hydrolase [Roridomyces roridus]|uniref:Alpha/beta-hydrolase n=1 Tax=Roridomyces roridus TaxID=1738132 RepID=A0AAD7BPB0_9AGAR|nr:alpha/beta-hydrolase [Roridomyces roridus]
MLLATFLAAFGVAAVTAQQPTVTIKNGTVRGIGLPQFSQSIFLGIPYAQPPVGDLRLRPPRSINASFGTLDATAYSPHCWSAFTTGFDDNSGFPNSEDCLTLNVIRPTGVSEKSPVPVVVWIHGGGLVRLTHSQADFRYNGSWIVEASISNGHPIVFVSINYRLASLGFLGGKALQDEGSLNLGVRDQRLALHWVQENIAQFGGDPTRVTIQGESSQSGATSVHAQIIAFAGRDDKLFHQAIAESGTGGGNFSLATSAASQKTFNNLIANTSCASTANGTEEQQLACIRALPIDEFRENSVGGTGLVFDGDFINVPGFFQAYKDGQWVRVAFIVGSNTDEGRSFSALGANTTAQAAALLNAPAAAQMPLLALYPDVPGLGCPFETGDLQPAGSPPGTQNKRVAAANGDIVMAAGPRWLAQQISSQVPFFKYRFNHVPWNTSFAPIDYISHFLEVSYVFNLQNDDIAFWVTNHFTATFLGAGAPIADRFLGSYMAASWAAFIATGDPNNANIASKIHWPKYSEQAANMVWQTQGSMVEQDNFREEGMQFIIDHVFFP